MGMDRQQRENKCIRTLNMEIGEAMLSNCHTLL
ncbi:hypothetical protein F383_22495 [Gossypium arboreum]|uniref:Uncharacterized protein n=1 Tax=Gossypium arboreum TaxID=29729 RepID=A0A0B0MNF1_GOSAR|nr:hypothetical protein F383_22495 [Gossypium arboreum]